MAGEFARSDDSVLLLIDMQPSFMRVIHGIDAVKQRCLFLLEVAKVLEIPILATEQNQARMGSTDPDLLGLLPDLPVDKQAFSCWGAPGIPRRLSDLSRRQIVIIGIETPICVTQTALDLLHANHAPILAVDAIGGRGPEAHRIALNRLGQAGVTLAFSESIAYEWLKSADHPKFRDVLALVKKYPTLENAK